MIYDRFEYEDENLTKYQIIFYTGVPNYIDIWTITSIDSYYRMVEYKNNKLILENNNFISESAIKYIEKILTLRNFL